MTTHAPDISPGYPSNGRHVGPAWRAIWQELEGVSAGDYVDGTELAERHAVEGSVMASTLMGVISRAARMGLLDRETRKVMGTRGPRPRTAFRISEAGHALAVRVNREPDLLDVVAPSTCEVQS